MPPWSSSRKLNRGSCGYCAISYPQTVRCLASIILDAHGMMLHEMLNPSDVSTLTDPPSFKLSAWIVTLDP
jgi:hypothetical protein